VSIDRSKRESHFPAIEARYGKPISHWLKILRARREERYADQMTFLQSVHGFSRAHANALIMYLKGSTSSKRFATPAEFFATLEPDKAKLVRKIIRTIKSKFPKLELVMAWNQPMFKLGDRYIFGISVAKNHILIAPFDSAILEKSAHLLTGYKVLKKTIRIPLDWRVDEKLLIAIIKESIARKKSG